ncbi:fungal-specific transcription factor domain-containing protein [Cristinia sonorae]|uniref:Fungal-specific transcription factor domain-containing protein n=1 Tax=Cristinia sonorae TaxID=1940300 RepID=A0A8K0XPE9_9AGAR|nr:fungal-specific transcription factor domain-containing protein [Cristinia sonorae]
MSSKNTESNGDKPPVANGEQKQRKRPGRVPVSCAECRRLKLRCDRKVPCETCVKRGCSAICPEGSLTTGKGSRLAFADAEELHKKIDRLRKRVSSLEDALRTLQSAVSDDPHPLLQQEDAMDDRDGSRHKGSPITGPPLSREDEEFLDAFGTLTLGLRGESRFFGQTSRSEYLVYAPESVPPCISEATLPHLTLEMVDTAREMFEVPVPNEFEMKKTLLDLLPPLSQACRLCEIFLEHGEYLWTPLPRNQLFDEILGVIYRTTPLFTNETNLVSTHALSLLFMVFALASSLDLEKPAYQTEAREYYFMARLALKCAPPVTDCTLWAIQSLIYMGIFLELGDWSPSHMASHTVWIHTGFAVKLGYSIGLHVNSARWQLDPEASQRRSSVFWQLFYQDTWISFGFGRPPTMSLSFVDCDMPKDPEESVDASGHHNWGYHTWSWQYSKLLHTVMTQAFGSRHPHYSTVLELDKQVRDFPLPWRMRVKCGYPEEAAQTPGIKVQRWFGLSCKEATLLNLHRAYFAQALKEQPQDLLRHRYGPSVMATYRSAWRLIEALKEACKSVSPILGRLRLPWSQCLSAAIVMCLLVTRAPTSSLAQSSLLELDRAAELFEEVGETSIAARNNLEVVLKLRRQAHEAADKAESLDRSHPGFTELERIGGKTHLISTNGRVAPRGSPNGSSNSSSPVACADTPSSCAGSISPIPVDAIHPTIMQDMRTFEGVGDFQSVFTPPLTGTLDIPHVFGGDHPMQQQPSPQTNPTPPSTFEAFPDMYLSNPDLFSVPAPPPSTYTDGTSPMNVHPPVLDATWQSFIEQLGF